MVDISFGDYIGIKCLCKFMSVFNWKECWGFYVLLYEKLNLKRFFFLNVVCDLWYVFMEFKYIFIEI